MGDHQLELAHGAHRFIWLLPQGECGSCPPHLTSSVPPPPCSLSCRYEYILPEWAFDPRRGLGRSAQAAAQVAAEAAAAAAGEVAGEAAVGGEAEVQEGEQQEQEQEEQQQAADGPASELMAVNGADAAAAAEAAPAAGVPVAVAAASGQAAAPADSDQGVASAAAADGGEPFVFDGACVQRMNEILSNVRAVAWRLGCSYYPVSCFVVLWFVVLSCWCA